MTAFAGAAIHPNPRAYHRAVRAARLARFYRARATLARTPAHAQLLERTAQEQEAVVLHIANHLIGEQP
jgi:hypothetical protein